MASSRHNEVEYSYPEIIYQDCIVYNEDGTKKESYTKCPLCNELSKSFYCTDCVKNGNFTYSKKKFFERNFIHTYLLQRFAEKKPKKYKLEEEKAVVLRSYEVALAKKKEIENVKLSILLCREKIQSLQLIIEKTKNNITTVEKEIGKIKREKRYSNRLQECLVERTKKSRNEVKRERDRLSLEESNLNAKQCALLSVANQRVKELVTHIFPIRKVPPPNYIGEDHYADLEEAQKTTYVQGQWVIAGTPMDNMQYKIVEACIPSTGDYSAYPHWCSLYTNLKNTSCAEEVLLNIREYLSEPNQHLFDTANGISGALWYTAQMVNILAFYLDVHLTNRSSINDFSREENVKRFYHNVAKLNANIINLCLSQNVDVSKLSPHRTVSNLLLLFDSRKCDKSIRYASLEDQELLLDSLEDSIFKDLPLCDSVSSDHDAEFVHVSDDEDIEVPESELKPALDDEAEFVHLSDAEALEIPEVEQVEPVQQTQESMLTSVVSLWKGAQGWWT